VSERKRAEEEDFSARAADRDGGYSAAVAALEEGVVVIDRNGAVAAANDSATRILGSRLRVGQGDAIFTGGAPHSTTTPPPSRPRISPSPWRCPSRGTTDVIIGVHDDDDNAQWLSVSSRPIDDARTRRRRRGVLGVESPIVRSCSTGWPGKRATTPSHRWPTAAAFSPP